MLIPFPDKVQLSLFAQSKKIEVKRDPSYSVRGYAKGPGFFLVKDYPDGKIRAMGDQGTSLVLSSSNHAWKSLLNPKKE